MIALDTNVLVRYLMMDDPEQSRRAAAFIDGIADAGDRMYVSHVVLCEVSWVLGRAYRMSKANLVSALSAMARTAQFTVEDPDIAGRALRRYQSGGADFADYLIAERARAAGCERLATFDRKLLAEDGFIQP